MTTQIEEMKRRVIEHLNKPLGPVEKPASTRRGYIQPTMEYVGRFTRAELGGIGDVYDNLELSRSIEMDLRDLYRHGEKKFIVRERDGWNFVPYALVFQDTGRGIDVKYFSAVRDMFSEVVKLEFGRLKGC